VTVRSGKAFQALDGQYWPAVRLALSVVAAAALLILHLRQPDASLATFLLLALGFAAVPYVGWALIRVSSPEPKTRELLFFLLVLMLVLLAGVLEVESTVQGRPLPVRTALPFGLNIALVAGGLLKLFRGMLSGASNAANTGRD
jgi:hypothetical protein